MQYVLRTTCSSACHACLCELETVDALPCSALITSLANMKATKVFQLRALFLES